MKGAPSTIQEGQGFAQILQPGFAAKAYLSQQAQADEAAQKKAAQIERSRAEIQGKLKDISGAKIWATRDGDDYRKEYMNRMNKYNGKWDLIAKGNTPEAEQFNQDILDLGLLAQKSTESKLQAEQWEKELFGEGAGKYTDEDRAQFNEWVAAPLNFEQPKFLADFGIDPVKLYAEQVGNPYQEHAFKNAKSGGGFNDEYGYTYENIVGDPKVREGLESTLRANPQFVSTVEKRFGKEAKEKGFDDTLEYFFTQQRQAYEVNKRQYTQTRPTGQGKIEISEDNIIDDFQAGTEKSPFPTEFSLLGKSYGGRAEAPKGKAYQTITIKASTPLSDKTYDLSGKKVNVEGAYDVKYSTPTLLRFDIDKTGNVKFNPNGKQQDVFIYGEAFIPTGEKNDKGETVYEPKVLLRPAKELAEPINQSGYDYKAIENMLNKSAPTKTTEVERLDKKSGKMAIFDAETKQFIRWK